MRREDVVNVELMNIDLSTGMVRYIERKKGGRIRDIVV